jgi:non-ribosomal peptide synthetase component F
LGAIAARRPLVVEPQAVARAPQAFLALLASERVTVLNQTPSAFRRLLPFNDDGRGLAVLYIAGTGLAQGYHSRPALTARALRRQSVRGWTAPLANRRFRVLGQQRPADVSRPS